MSIAIVYFQSHDTTLDILARTPGMTDIHFFKTQVYRCFGETSALLQDDVCGAAFLEDDTHDVGVTCLF